MSVDAFRRAVEAQDLDALTACLTDDVVLVSPVADQPFEGKEAVRVLLSSVLRVLENLRFTESVEGDGVTGLMFHAQVAEKEIEGIGLLRLDADERVSCLTVMMRPLSSLTAFYEATVAQLSAARGERTAWSESG